ncbi:MAG: FAD-dependent oxidoreductase [Devosia sp.]
MAERVLIAGGSHAGIGTADSLRRSGFDGEIIVLTEEIFRPYQRPPLSKDAGFPDDLGASIALRKPDFYAAQRIDLRLGAPIASVDATARSVRLGDGSTLEYSHLVLATGARARQLPAHLLAGRSPLVMRSYRDALDLREHLLAAQSLAIVGGGMIGLEVAALASSLGCKVTVIEAAPRLLGRVAPERLADRVAAFHAGQGVDVRLGETLAALTGGADGYELCLHSGATIAADLALVSIGTEPRVDLALTAGLAIDNGILVSGTGQTSHERIWAVGDCCNWLIDAEAGRRFRFEGIQPATEQARIVAQAIAGKPAAVLPMPRFWSHQGALRLQMAGTTSEHATYLPMATASGAGECLLAVEHGIFVACYALNAPDEFRVATRLVETRAALAEESGRLLAS